MKFDNLLINVDGFLKYYVPNDGIGSYIMIHGKIIVKQQKVIYLSDVIYEALNDIYLVVCRDSTNPNIIKIILIIITIIIITI